MAPIASSRPASVNRRTLGSHLSDLRSGHGAAEFSAAGRREGAIGAPIAPITFASPAAKLDRLTRADDGDRPRRQAGAKPFEGLRPLVVLDRNRIARHG